MFKRCKGAFGGFNDFCMLNPTSTWGNDPIWRSFFVDHQLVWIILDAMMRLKSRKESPPPVAKLFMGGVYMDSVFFLWIFSGCLIPFNRKARFFTPQIVKEFRRFLRNRAADGWRQGHSVGARFSWDHEGDRSDSLPEMVMQVGLFHNRQTCLEFGIWRWICEVSKIDRLTTWAY